MFLSHVRPNCPTRKGFTLVELLVVIAIIGILVGMLLPAVQMVREAARRTTCLNSIKNLGLAAQNYQSSNGFLPPASNVNGDSLTVLLLPFIEQQAIADAYKASAQNLAARVALAGNEIPILYCGSAVTADRLSTDTATGIYTTHYYGSSGPADAAMGAANIYKETRRTSGDPVGLQGVFSPYSTTPDTDTADPVFWLKHGKTTADLRDGSSNCLAFGESSRSANPQYSFAPKRPGWAVGYNTPTSGIGLVYSANSINNQGTSPSRINGTNVSYNGHSFGSNHPGGCNLGMADGSSRYVNEAIDILTLQAVAGIADGQIANLDDIK